MAIQIKRLDLHGFKSFATASSFVFDSGITAVIGPNGSGKSNIADAMRWVLGEQSYGNLRSRRTEDVVFAGSSARTPAGMAEVSLTLDNSDGGLPLPYSEVTITRRAYRSGENQYLINRSQVRLKDVLQLTSSLGQAHTVIGQGLVDAALSQRPEERRGLFEHAAGITGLRLKYAEAERHLHEARANSARLEDLLRELEPRLRSLERAARRAREFTQVRDELNRALRRYYACQWRGATERLEAAKRAANRAGTALQALQRETDAAIKAAAGAEEQAGVLRTQRETLVGEAQRLRDERRHLEHQLAVLTERRTAAERRANDASRAIEEPRESLAEADREIRQFADALVALDTEIAGLEREIVEREAADALAREQRAKLETELRSAEQQLAGIDQSARAAEARLALLDQQQRDLNENRQRLDADASSRAKRHGDLVARADAASRELEDASNQLNRLREERREVDGRITANRSARDDAGSLARRLEHQFIECSARLEALERLRDSGAGLRAGTRAVLDATRGGKLIGIVGLLSSLIAVPAELERAVEAALGGHLQDIVVERWADAEQAIEYLKRTRGGRATFRPLDTVRARRPAQLPRHSVSGVRGIASELVECDDRVTPIVAGLLGQVVIVDTLDAARALLPALHPSWAIVTLGGEIARASGTVTGGAEMKETGLLAREREFRELPARRRSIERELGAARTRIEELSAAGRTDQEHKAKLDHAIGDIQKAISAATATLDQTRRWIADLDRAREQEQARRSEIAKRVTGITVERQSVEVERGRLATARATAIEECRCLADRLGSDDDLAKRRDGLQHARAALGTLRERRRGLEQQRMRLTSQRALMERQIDEAERRRQVLVEERARLDHEASRLSTELDRAKNLLDEAQSRVAGHQQAVDRATEDERSARAWAAGLADRLRNAEREFDQLELDCTRRRDEIDLWRERVVRDLGDDGIDQLRVALQVDDSLDLPDLEREIARQRERLRRIGLVGEDAVEQYEQEAERDAFLRQQLDDVRRAGESLESLMLDLERTMAGQFDRTFADVAAAFEVMFRSLFGGGQARLVRADEAGKPNNIDIIAQPPGKRLQNLSLLSGGERTLTAVALLFAILRVNPSPFCLLDEVDAALDEANVVRVRETLRDLARNTQFVVITHNRATIEGADTLYGITMGRDGISRVLSMRVPVEA